MQKYTIRNYRNLHHALVLICFLITAGAANEQDSLTFGIQRDSVESIPEPKQPKYSKNDDHSLLVSMSAMPLFSGLYLTDKPELGVFSTLIDVILIAGIWQAKNGSNQKENSERTYWVLLGINNVADVAISYLTISSESKIKAGVGLDYSGRPQARISYRF